MIRTFLLILCFLPIFSWAATIENIEFEVKDGLSQVTIASDDPIEFEKEVNETENQIVLTLSGAKLGPAATRDYDTSSFDSPVLLVSPYQLEEENDQVRIVVQMKKNVPADVFSDGNKIFVTVQGESASAVDAAPSSPVQEKSNMPTFSGNPSVEQFSRSQSTQNFTGTPISLRVRDADVRDVLRLIGEASGFNMLIGPEVKGTISLSLEEVPWDQVLDVVLKTMQLGAERNKNILRILTLKNLTEEKQKQLDARLLAQRSAAKVTKVFPLSYAKADELQKTVVSYRDTIAKQLGSNQRGATIEIDKRTNSIIVQDTPENAEKIRKLIEILDTQTPQVMIEAKVIEATESFSRTISGNLGLGGPSGGRNLAVSFGGANPVDSLIGSPGVFDSGSDVASSSSNGGIFGVSPGISFLPGVERLNALLNIGETDQQVRVIAAPKTVVLNQEAANILQSTPVIIQNTVVNEGVTTVENNVIQANLSLGVTPTITNDENVIVSLEVNRDIPQTTSVGIDAVANRSLKTRVVVESGSTLVIGGIYVADTIKAEGGFPFLRKIPILGFLFGSESKSVTRSELLIFLTPRILNSKKAGFV